MVRSMDDLDILGELYVREVINGKRKNDEITQLQNEMLNVKRGMVAMYNIVTNCDRVPKAVKEQITEIYGKSI